MGCIIAASHLKLSSFESKLANSVSKLAGFRFKLAKLEHKLAKFEFKVAEFVLKLALFVFVFMQRTKKQIKELQFNSDVKYFVMSSRADTNKKYDQVQRQSGSFNNNCILSSFIKHTLQ